MEVPTNIVTDLMSAVGSVFDGFLPMIIVILGLKVTFYLVKKINELLP